jgi:hypothetical protein
MDGVNELPDYLTKALETLDARSARAAARVDAERVAGRVLARLRSEPVVAVAPRRTWTALRIAAVLAVFVTGGLFVRAVSDWGRPATVAALPVDVPESLSAQQATAVLDAVAASTDSAAWTATVVSVEDLNEAELRALLRAMQSDMEGSL